MDKIYSRHPESNRQVYIKKYKRGMLIPGLDLIPIANDPKVKL